MILKIKATFYIRRDFLFLQFEELNLMLTLSVYKLSCYYSLIQMILKLVLWKLCNVYEAIRNVYCNNLFMYIINNKKLKCLGNFKVTKTNNWIIILKYGFKIIV